MSVYRSHLSCEMHKNAYHKLCLDILADVLVPGVPAEEDAEYLLAGVQLYRHLHRLPAQKDLLRSRTAFYGNEVERQ